jgi:Uma2 family endonuclease
MRFDVNDLASFPDDGRRREIIAGELLVSWAPHYRHQQTGGLCAYVLTDWSGRTGRGIVLPSSWLVLGEFDVVIPDVVWVSHERLARLADDSGCLAGAPELVIEVLAPDEISARRDREVKRKLYSMFAVPEYWVLDWRLQMVAIYRYHETQLYLEATLWREDVLTSPLLPGFDCPVARLFG